MEAQKAEYLRMPAWYERQVESVIAWDWGKAKWCAKGALLTWEPELGLSLLLGQGNGTKISGDETRNQQYRNISANNMSDKNCVVVGSGAKEYRTNKN